MTRRNRPQKGDIIKVQPLPNTEAVAAIENLLKPQKRNTALFTLGVNTNLRACDMRKLTVGDVGGLEAGHILVLREQKTGKVRRITLNAKVCRALHAWLAEHPDPRPDAPLFPSRRTGRALQVSTLNNLVKQWCREVGLPGNFGSHTLRKTFGYLHRTVHQTDIVTLMVLYNHSSQKQTLDYLCVQPDEVRDAYLKEI